MEERLQGGEVHGRNSRPSHGRKGDSIGCWGSHKRALYEGEVKGTIVRGGQDRKWKEG